MLKRIAAAVLAVLIGLGLCACSGGNANALTITVFKIGKADAILLRTASSAVLIDAGEKDDSEEILEKVSEMGVKKLDYLIVSHYDKDHIGGAAGVIRGIEIGEIIEPGYEWDSEVFYTYYKAADQAGIRRTVPEGDLTFEIDGARYTVIPAEKDFYEDKNDYSMAVRVEFGGQSALFAGDALDARMQELMKRTDLSSDVLKVPHHGEIEQTSAAFFEAVRPQYAVITCSDKNPADAETLAALQALGCHVLQTVHGDVILRLSDKGIEAGQS